jgi:hypothetical protein
MKKAVKPFISFLLGVLLTGTLVGTLFEWATDPLYFGESYSGTAKEFIVAEFILYIAILALGKILPFFSKQLKANAYWQSWLIFNIILLLEIVLAFKSERDNSESFAGLGIIFVLPAALLIAFIFACFKSERKSR